MPADPMDTETIYSAGVVSFLEARLAETEAERDRFQAALTQVVRLMRTYFLRDERKNAVIDAAREYVILEEKWQSGKGMFIGVGNVDKAGAALREAIKRLDAS